MTASLPPEMPAVPQGQAKRWLPYLALLVPPVFYFLTTARTIGQGDQAILISSMAKGTLSASATHHNLTVLTGYAFFHLLPLPEIAYRCNLVSTFYGSLTVAVFYLLALRSSRNVLVAGFAAAFLMVAHTLWWHSTIAENYATSAFVSALILYLLVRFDEKGEQRWLYAAAAAAGFGVFNHMQMGMWFPGILLAALLHPAASRRERIVRAARAALWIGVGLLPYAAIFLMEMGQTHSLDKTAWDAVGADFAGLFFSAGSLTVVKQALVSTGRIFMMQWGWPSLFWAYVAAGVYRAVRGSAPRATLLAAGVAFLVNTGFFAFYPTWDKYAFLLQSVVVVAFFGLIGLDHVWTASGGRSGMMAAAFVLANAFFCLYPVYFFAHLPELAKGSRLWRSFAVRPAGINMVGSDGPFLAQPNKRRYRSVDDFARRLFATLPADSLLIDHPSRTYYPLTYYFQTFYGMRPDVAIVLFAPADLLGASAQRWPDSLDTPETVDLVAQRMESREVFLAAHLGFEEVVGPLLDRGVTFTEYPLGGPWLVYQARRAGDLRLQDWVESVQAGAFDARPPQGAPPVTVIARGETAPLGVYVLLKKGSPPMKAHVEWTRADGGARAVGPDYFIPQGASVVFIRGAGLKPAAGPWAAELIAFGQSLGQARFMVE